jgi:hypothetical protein
MQNAETAAWGRAIVAALAADTKKGIASSEEIRNRQVDPPADPIVAAKNRLAAAVASAGIDLPEFMDWAVSDIDCDIRTADTETLDGLTRRVETEGKTMIGSTK